MPSCSSIPIAMVTGKNTQTLRRETPTQTQQEKSVGVTLTAPILVHVLVPPPHQVFERGVAAIPLSVDLWVHFAGFKRAQLATGLKEEAEGEEGSSSELDAAAKSEMRRLLARASSTLPPSHLLYSQTTATIGQLAHMVHCIRPCSISRL